MPGLPLLIICEVLTVVPGSMCVAMCEAGGRAGSAACIMGCGAWAHLAPGHPSGHWKSLDWSSIVMLLITIAVLAPADSASKLL